MSKRDRDLAKARRIVEQQKAAERRRTVTVWTSVAVVAVLLMAGLIGWGVLANQEKQDAGRLTVPAAAVDDSTAFAFGEGAVTVDIYEDFMCPVCNEFEKQTGATIQQMVADKKITVRYHPVSILDRASNGTEFSTRAAGAAAAAAGEGKFREYHDALFANQPAEGTDGLSDAQLIELGRSVGLGDKFAQAVTDRTYDAWVAKATDTFASRGLSGTPTIVVNGKQVQGAGQSVPTAADFTQAVTAAAG
jgi:protein-disulfide isomerase